MNGRIEWSRYEGDDVESVIAMMLNREHPNSVRISPSQGDGGVDVLDRGAGPGGGDVVYQVKKHTGPLSPDQKNKIRHSLETLLHPTKRDARWKNLNVTQWRLVLPWDATPEADSWFHKTLLRGYEVDGVWDGLVVVDQLAAKYDDVIDYYLHGGKSAVIEAMKTAMSLVSLEKVTEADLSATEVATRVEAALPVLKHDPHYAYEFRFGHGEPPPPLERPRLVMSTYQVYPSEATWHAIDVLALCEESARQRPITISGEFVVEPGSDFAQSLKDFNDFGTPFTSPEGAYTGRIDAPGGLDGDLNQTTVRAWPVSNDDVSEAVRLRLEILGTEGQTLATVEADRTEKSRGAAGVRVCLTEVNDVFDLTVLFNLKTRTTEMRVSSRESTGKPVSAVRPAVDFLANFHHPNTLRTSNRFTPARHGTTMQFPPDRDSDDLEPAKVQAHIMQLLEELQLQTSKQLRVPDPDLILNQSKSWEFAAAILGGQTVSGTVREDHAFMAVLDENTSFPRDSFIMEVPNEVNVGTDRVNLGTMYASFDQPVQISEPIKLGSRVTYSFTTSDRKVSYSREAPS